MRKPDPGDLVAVTIPVLAEVVAVVFIIGAAIILTGIFCGSI